MKVLFAEYNHDIGVYGEKEYKVFADTEKGAQTAYSFVKSGLDVLDGHKREINPNMVSLEDFMVELQESDCAFGSCFTGGWSVKRIEVEES